jgi:hypothetical protein
MKEQKWILGIDLRPEVQAEAKARFVHRWTHENAKQTYGGKCPGCEQAANGGHIVTGGAPGFPKKVWTREEWHAYHIPLVSDAEWLASTSFAVNEDGTLSNKVNHCLQRPPHRGGLKAETANA